MPWITDTPFIRYRPRRNWPHSATWKGERVAQKYENRAKNCGRTERAVTSEDKRFLAAPREKNGRQLSLLSKISFTQWKYRQFTFFPFLFKEEFMR